MNRHIQRNIESDAIKRDRAALHGWWTRFTPSVSDEVGGKVCDAGSAVSIAANGVLVTVSRTMLCVSLILHGTVWKIFWRPQSISAIPFDLGIEQKQYEIHVAGSPR